MTYPRQIFELLSLRYEQPRQYSRFLPVILRRAENTLTGSDGWAQAYVTETINRDPGAGQKVWTTLRVSRLWQQAP
jgi:hypothetical protein